MGDGDNLSWVITKGDIARPDGEHKKGNKHPKRLPKVLKLIFVLLSFISQTWLYT